LGYRRADLGLGFRQADRQRCTVSDQTDGANGSCAVSRPSPSMRPAPALVVAAGAFPELAACSPWCVSPVRHTPVRHTPLRRWKGVRACEGGERGMTAFACARCSLPLHPLPALLPWYSFICSTPSLDKSASHLHSNDFISTYTHVASMSTYTQDA